MCVWAGASYMQSPGLAHQHLAVPASLAQLSLPSRPRLPALRPPPRSLQFPYSQIAAAATYVAQLAVGVADPYSHTLQRYSGYTLPAIMDCAQHLANLMRKAPNSSLVAVYKKVGGGWQGA